jgi:PAS domain S-box-containing protein
VSFTLFGVVLTGICELLHRAWRRIEDRQRRLEEEVNARRRAQVAEQVRADELMATLASIGDGVIRTDSEGRVTYLNPVAEELVGWKTAEAAGRFSSEIFHIVDEATRQPVENPVERALKNDAIVALTNRTILISRDGNERPIDDSARPIRDTSGNVIGSVLVFKDISERQRGQAALQESERRYRAIGDSIDYGVWVCDSLGQNAYASESFLRLVGLTQEECSTFGWGTVLHPDDAEATIAAWNKCVKFGDRFDREHRVKGVDGRWHYILARGIPIKNEHGEVASWVGINLDISRLKQVEEELRNDDRRKDEFLATLAHELRNPLAPIWNSLQILKMPSVDTETAQQTREMMERQLHHLVRLVDDLLDVSRVMRGKIDLRLERVELATVVAHAVEMAQPLIEAREQRLEILLTPPSLPLNADPVRLAQVIGNLLTNSAKYSEANGHIRLAAWREGDQVLLSVRDNGIGIATEMLPHVFELFVQVDHRSTKSQGGMGIGLTLVKNLVEMHGGSVAAQSAGLGQGSEFLVKLPLAIDPPPNPKQLNLETQHQSPSPSRLRLLVVDDNKDAARSLAMLLRLKGHEVQVAHSGVDALEMVVNYVPNLVLLDIGMPVMDGYEVSRRMRNTPGLERTILAALTGWGQAEDRSRTSEAGFDYHLMKPPEPQALESLLADLTRTLAKP